MAERDKSQPIRIAGFSEAPEGVFEEVICYTVVLGRGRAMVRHMRDQQSRDFAHALAASFRFTNEVRRLLEDFDDTEWPDKAARRHGRTELVRAMRKRLAKVPLV